MKNSQPLSSPAVAWFSEVSILANQAEYNLCLFDGIAYIIDPEFISDTGAPEH